MPDEKEEELTLLEAAIRFDIESEDLHLALEQLEALREPDPSYFSGRVALWRGVRKTKHAGNITTYKRSDCEAAVSLLAAKRLGYDPDAA